MPPWAPGRMATIIDLTSDDIDTPSSETIDLTSVDDPQPPAHTSHEPEVKVEDESSTLVGSTTTDSGGSSPKTQRDDNTAQTESDPTNLGDLGPGNPQDEGSSSADEDLSLGAILARSKKRKHVSGDAPASEPKPHDITHLTPEAFGSLVGPQSLKPGFDKSWFGRIDCPVDEPRSAKPQQDSDSKAQQERQSTKNANSHVLNFVREEVFGPEKKEKKHRSKPSKQKGPVKQQSRTDEQPSRTPVPRRAASEVPATPRPKKNIGSSEIARPSQPCEDIESQRPHKRHKQSGRDDTTCSSTSLAAASNTTRVRVPPPGELQSHRSETSSLGGSCPAGKDKVTDIYRGASRYRPGDARPHRVNKAAHIERRQKKHKARAWEQPRKPEHAGPSRQKGEKTFMLAAQNGRGQWGHSGFQRAGTASQRPPDTKFGRKATSGRDWDHHEAHQQPYDLNSSTTGSRLPSESDAVRTAPTGQDEDVREDEEVPEVRSQQSQQAHDNYGQQESRRVQSKLNVAQPASRFEQHEQTMSLDAGKKVMEEAKQFFESHPSNLAPQRKVEIVNSVPPDVSRPSFLVRRQMVKASNGRRSGRKFRTATQKAEKRDRDRQKQIMTRRQKLEVEVNQLFPNNSEETKAKYIEDGVAKLRQVFTKNDQKREAQTSQGLLTVEDIEDMGGAGSDRFDRPSEAAPKGKRRGIPVADAIEPGATITLYVVYISDPVDKGKQFGDYDMKRLGDQFLRKEDANKHAEDVLRDVRHDDSQLVSIQFRVGPEDGLFFGTKELADGKLVMCMVQRERQMSSKLDLRDTFVRKELKEIYRPRFDVFYTNVIPKVFLEREEVSTDENRKENSKSKPKSKTPTTDAVEEPEPAEKEHVDEDRDSLFSAPPTPEPEVSHDERAEAKEDEQDDEGDDSDANSVATDVTLAPSKPGGNLGSLSWNDVEYMHEHVCGFTTLELANEEAVKVALKLWRPRGTRMDPWLYFRNAIKPSLEEVRTQDLDVEAARLEFEVPEFEGHVDDRPWPFIYSMVFVKETRLEGPRDIGNYIVMGNGDDSGEDGEDGEDGKEDGEDD